MGGKRGAEIKVKGATFDEEDWRSRGSCRGVDPAIMFPVTAFDEMIGKRVCANCPSKSPCLQYALNNNEKDGIWGETTESERNRIQRQRRRTG